MKNFKKYVIMTDDGPGYKDEFLTYSTKKGYYTTTPRFGSLSECDTFNTILEAEDRCKDANSGTFGGWEDPFRIMELITPYKGRGTPELKEVKTITYIFNQYGGDTYGLGVDCEYRILSIEEVK